MGKENIERSYNGVLCIHYSLIVQDDLMTWEYVHYILSF